jgi:hypothetical protein
MYSQNQTKCYKLPCGKMMNGTMGNQRTFSKRFELHKKFCDECAHITLNEFNNKLTSYHYKSSNCGIIPQSFISSQLEKYY